VWSPVTNSFGSSNDQLSVTLPLEAGSHFFRLTSP
jgi:hypothetical protein